MYIAHCVDAPVFKRDQLRDRQWSNQFPGSGWISCLYAMADTLGIAIASGDVALENIKSGLWSAEDVHVIQDMQSTDAGQLLKLGAQPFLITCLEAPIYAHDFFDNLPAIAKKFKFGTGFGFAVADSVIGDRQNIPFAFPCFYQDEIQAIRPWQLRKKLVLVAANKYKTATLFLPAKLSLLTLLRHVKWLGIRLLSKTYSHSLALSLHDKRLDVIRFFAEKQLLDVYGGGWNNLDNLPVSWAKKLAPVLLKAYKGKCDDKLSTIADYRFAVCIENMVSPGYITEKIAHCFVAGTIPLYLGAPDIERYIPQEAFIDLSKFADLEQLNSYLDSIDESQALQMIQAGRDYLQTEQGRLHSYQDFADYVIGWLKQ